VVLQNPLRDIHRASRPDQGGHPAGEERRETARRARGQKTALHFDLVNGILNPADSIPRICEMAVEARLARVAVQDSTLQMIESSVAFRLDTPDARAAGATGTARTPTTTDKCHEQYQIGRWNIHICYRRLSLLMTFD
jgi:hypothetical protein